MMNSIILKTNCCLALLQGLEEEAEEDVGGEQDEGEDDGAA